MDTRQDKRKIDDPELNRDVDYQRKDEEDFDDTDDFHKNDPTGETPERETETPDINIILPENQGANDEIDTESVP